MRKAQGLVLSPQGGRRSGQRNREGTRGSVQLTGRVGLRPLLFLPCQSIPESPKEESASCSLVIRGEGPPEPETGISRHASYSPWPPSLRSGHQQKPRGRSLSGSRAKPSLLSHPGKPTHADHSAKPQAHWGWAESTIETLLRVTGRVPGVQFAGVETRSSEG